MVKLEIVEAILNMDLGKKKTFTKGERYWSRKSKDGTNVMALSNELEWVVISNKQHTKIIRAYDFFEYKTRVFCKDYCHARDVITFITPKQNIYGVDY